MYEPNYVRISLIAVCSVLMATLLIIADAVNHVAYTLPDLVQAEAQKTRDDLDAQLALVRTDVVKQLAASTSDADGHLTAIRSDLNHQLNDTRADLFVQLANTEHDLNDRLSDTNAIMDHALEEYGNAGATAAALFLGQTQELKDMVITVEPLYRSRFLATTGELNRTLDATRRMAEEGAKVLPELLANAQTLSTNSVKISDNVEHYTNPKGFWRAGVLAAVKQLHILVP